MVGVYKDLSDLFGITVNEVDHNLRYIRSNGFPDFGKDNLTAREFGYLGAFIMEKKVREKSYEEALEALINRVENDLQDVNLYEIKRRVVVKKVR